MIKKLYKLINRENTLAGLILDVWLLIMCCFRLYFAQKADRVVVFSTVGGKGNA